MTRRALAAILGLAAARFALPVCAEPLVPLGMEKVFYDGIDDQGRLTGGRVLKVRPLLDQAILAPTAPVTTIIDNGSSANRIDLVVVGDGYVEADLGLYGTHVTNSVNALFSQQPFSNYRTFFNVHRVDVISNESGVDNDPTPGINRDTAMDMGFWCGGIERLLCVDVLKAYGFAAAAPEVDHVLAVANSTKFGGAGYSDSDLATYSGGDAGAHEIAIHEIGHSLGNLADEFYFADGSTYPGPDPIEPNVSTLTAAEMAGAGAKWASWLVPPGILGFDGPVSTYEGASYYQYGLYRPSPDSKMRNLGRPFNTPSAEALILQMYGFVSPIDTSGVIGADPPDGSSIVFVDPVDPFLVPLSIQWYLDGDVISGATQESLYVAEHVLPPGDHVLSVTVTDKTILVRNEAARVALMTATRSWNLHIAPSAASNLVMNGDAELGTTTGWTDWTGAGFDVYSGTSSTPVYAGSYSFHGGVNGPEGMRFNQVYQEIDVSEFQGAIDAGSLVAVLRGAARSTSVGGSVHTASIQVEYIDELWEVLDEYNTGNVAPPDAWALVGDSRTVPPGTRLIRVSLSAFRPGGTSTEAFFDNVFLGFGTPAGVSLAEQSRPRDDVVLRNAPNPFTTHTRISGVISPAPRTPRLRIYDVQGRLVREWGGLTAPGGAIEAMWDGCDEFGRRAAAGIYLYRLFDGERPLGVARKLVVAR